MAISCVGRRVPRSLFDTAQRGPDKHKYLVDSRTFLLLHPSHSKHQTIKHKPINSQPLTNMPAQTLEQPWKNVADSARVHLAGSEGSTWLDTLGDDKGLLVLSTAHCIQAKVNMNLIVYVGAVSVEDNS